MMRFKNMLKCFGKIELQEDKTHPTPPLEREGVNVSCAEHTVKNLSSNRPIVLTTSKKAAFTLAEVLITLGIIGVVAAMTLPALIHKYQMKSFEVAFKKEYSVIQNTIDYLTLENSISECAFDGIKNGSYTSVTEDCEALYDGLISQLKLSKINKNFSYAKQADVFANGGESINSGVSYDFFQQIANIYTLPDGATLAFWIGYRANVFFQICMVIDVNGLKGPNKWGYDAFFMTLVKHNNKILLTDEYASIIEKGGKYPRTILRNQDNNSPTYSWAW